MITVIPFCGLEIFFFLSVDFVLIPLLLHFPFFVCLFALLVIASSFAAHAFRLS